jgi:hypothetical protein
MERAPGRAQFYHGRSRCSARCVRDWDVGAGRACRHDPRWQRGVTGSGADRHLPDQHRRIEAHHKYASEKQYLQQLLVGKDAGDIAQPSPTTGMTLGQILHRWSSSSASRHRRSCRPERPACSSASASRARGEVGDTQLAGRMVEVTFSAPIRPLGQAGDAG